MRMYFVQVITSFKSWLENEKLYMYRQEKSFEVLLTISSCTSFKKIALPDLVLDNRIILLKNVKD